VSGSVLVTEWARARVLEEALVLAMELALV
jgi:hypothetical protein